MSDQTALPAVAAHGAHRLPSVHVDSYNLEIKDNQGFIGDRASKGAFRKVIDSIRKSVRKAGDDPLGDEESDELTKIELDNLLTRGEPAAAGIVQSAIEDFSQDFANVIRRFIKLKDWKDTEADCDRRRLPRQPGGRARDRTHGCPAQGRWRRPRPAAHPQ